MKSKPNNPFNITFGEQPKSFIPRAIEVTQITDAFDSETPESKVFVITGPRGSGKTVLLSHIKSIYDEQNGWLTVDLNPYGNMVEQLCAKIYEKGKIKHLFLKAEFNFSFQGIGFAVSGEKPISNADTLLEKIFSYLKKKEIRVLITVDDISNNENLKYFIHAYQNLIREKYDAFLLASGLYENISAIENDKGLTFFVRAPKIYLEKLSLIAITNSYMRILGADKENAIKLAKLTMGYAYGYQLLGNLLYKNDLKLDDEVMENFDSILEANVFSLIWKTLSKKDKTILGLIAEGNINNTDLLKSANITNSTLQVYKSRLFKAGLIDIETRGQITLSLPRFKEYVLLKRELEK